jgi:hypothetical protein
MDQATAVEAATAFARPPGVKAWVQLRLDGDADVWIEAPHHRRVITNLAPRAPAYFRQVRAEIHGL